MLYSFVKYHVLLLNYSYSNVFSAKSGAIYLAAYCKLLFFT